MKKTLLILAAFFVVTFYFFKAGAMAGYEAAHRDMQKHSICTIEDGQARAMSYSEYKAQLHLNKGE